MDFIGLFDLPLWMLLVPVPCGCILLYNYGVARYKTWERLGVPGPHPIPFLGHTNQLYDDKKRFRGCVEQWQREYGRIIGIYFFRRPSLIVTDLECLRQILVKDFSSFIDRYIPGDGYLTQRILKKTIFFDDGLQWLRLRRIMSPAFSSSKLKLLTYHMNLTSKRLAVSLSEKAKVGDRPDAKTLFAAFTLDAIAGTAFGLDIDSLNNPHLKFVEQAKSLLTFNSISMKLIIAMGEMFDFTGTILRLFKVGNVKHSPLLYFENELYSYINDRKTHPELFSEVDLIQLLLQAESNSDEDVDDDKKLTLEEVAAQGIIFIMAGYETSSSSLQYLMYELGKNQNIQEKLLSEIQRVVGDEEEPTFEHCQNMVYAEAAINEALRMYPPFNLITRKAVKETTLRGIRIPVNTPIFIPLFNIGRDPEYFEDPDTFNPDRFLGDNKNRMDAVSFLPFGFGPRQCIGLRLAMILLKITLVNVLRKVSIVDVSPKTLDLQDFSALLTPKENIKLTLECKM